MRKSTRILLPAIAVTLLAGVTPVALAQPDAAGSAQTPLRLTLLQGDVQQKVMDFLGSHEAHRQAILSLSQCRNCHQGADASTLADPVQAALQPLGPWIGVSVGPADGVLRSQLRLPDGAGVIVTQVLPNGPAQLAGLEPHDILLSVNGKPVTSAEDLEAQLRSAVAGKPLELELLRGGKPLEKHVTPQTKDYQSWLIDADGSAKPTYRIGVSMLPPDETLRKQLDLGGGFVVTDVNAGSPAEAAGIKTGDVLLSANGKPLTKHEELGLEVQRGAGSPVALDVMRSGDTLRLSVVPTKVPPQQELPAKASIGWLGGDASARDLMLVHPNYVELLGATTNPSTMPAPAADRLQQITEQLDQLRRAVDALRADLQARPADGKR